MENFTRLSIDQINVSIDDIAKEFEVYKAQLVEIMKSLKSSAPIVNQLKSPHTPIIGPDPGLDKYLLVFEGDFLNYRAF